MKLGIFTHDVHRRWGSSSARRACPAGQRADPPSPRAPKRRMMFAVVISAGWTLSPRHHLGSHCCAPTSRHCSPLQMAKGFGAPKKKAAAKSKRPEGNLLFEGQKTFDKHFELFKSLQDPEDRSNMVDCYVRAEGNDKFWFVGKAVAKAGSCDDAALAMVAQKRLVLEHSKALVRELAMATAPLQMWVAPPNTEMRVAQKMEGLRRIDQLKRGELSVDDCGYDPETWTDPKLGFKVRLGDDGQPVGAPTPAKIVAAEDLQDGVESMKLDLDTDAKVEVTVGGKAFPEPLARAAARAAAAEEKEEAANEDEK